MEPSLMMKLGEFGTEPRLFIVSAPPLKLPPEVTTAPEIVVTPGEVFVPLRTSVAPLTVVLPVQVLLLKRSKVPFPATGPGRAANQSGNPGAVYPCCTPMAVPEFKVMFPCQLAVVELTAKFSAPRGSAD